MEDVLDRPVSAHAARRRQIREEILEHLNGVGAVDGPELVETVSLESDATTAAVVAEMWVLVEDGDVVYEPGARIRREGAR